MYRHRQNLGANSENETVKEVLIAGSVSEKPCLVLLHSGASKACVPDTLISPDQMLDKCRIVRYVSGIEEERQLDRVTIKVGDS